MQKLPAISGKDLVRALEKAGFQSMRQKGSHVVMQKKTASEVVTTVVPLHDELAKGTLRAILRKTKISPVELAQYLTLILGTFPFLR